MPFLRRTPSGFLIRITRRPLIMRLHCIFLKAGWYIVNGGNRRDRPVVEGEEADEDEGLTDDEDDDQSIE